MWIAGIEDLEELPDVELPSEPEATAPPSTETEKPSVQSTACPSLTLSRSRISGSVCGKQCTFYTSVYGWVINLWPIYTRSLIHIKI